MHIIIMPPQHIIMGMPICIMLVMLSQHFMNMSFMDGSIGIISQVMPVGVMVYFIWQGIIIGMPIMFIIGIMLPAMVGFIMPPIIIGMGIICIAVFIVILQVGSRTYSPALAQEIKLPARKLKWKMFY
jgi:hypothetical protein